MTSPLAEDAQVQVFTKSPEDEGLWLQFPESSTIKSWTFLVESGGGKSFVHVWRHPEHLNPLQPNDQAGALHRGKDPAARVTAGSIPTPHLPRTPTHPAWKACPVSDQWSHCSPACRAPSRLCRSVSPGHHPSTSSNDLPPALEALYNTLSDSDTVGTLVHPHYAQ